MKFGRTYTVYVQTEAQRFLPECPYVEFKRFKKLLKKCPHIALPDASGAGASDLDGLTDSDDKSDDSGNALEESSSSVKNERHSSSCSVCDADFFPQLDKTLAAVVGCFNTRAKELLRLHMASGFRKYIIRLRSSISSDPGTMIQVGNTLLWYGCMNALAVRKILKKYDKVHGSENGRAFKSRLQVRRVELLQSPLLIELGALAVNLMDSNIGKSLAQPGEPGSSTCNFDEEKESISCVLPDGLRLDFNITCSICLEIVFEPVALGCGHIFCTSCACSAASVPSFQGPTVAKRSSKCPLCRQAGVYPHAKLLAELFTLIGNRCSDYYAERLPAERRQRLREAKEHWDRAAQSFVGL